MKFLMIILFLLFVFVVFGSTSRPSENIVISMKRPNPIRPIAPPSSTPTPTPTFQIPPSPPPCFDYQLENECSTFVNNQVVLDKPLQEAIFNFISLNVSDIRLLPFECRRPLLWYLCGSAFPPCPRESEEERLCWQIEGCHQVSEACDDFFSLDCPSLSFFELDSSLPCSSMVSEDLEKTTQHPIKVETCLGEESQTIECCPDPFIVDKGGECVVECLQYEFGERFETGIQITIFVFFWIEILVLFIGQLPFIFMSLTYVYPNYVVPLVCVVLITGNMFSIFAVFDGGSKNYICGNEENYFVALPRFSRSTVAGVQMSFLSLCVSLAASLWLLSVFNTFCFVVRSRWKWFNRFVEQPVSKKIELSLVFPCFFINLAFFLFYIIYFFTHDSPSDNLFAFPFPFVSAAFPNNTTFEVLRIYTTIILSLLVILVLATIGFLLTHNWRIISFQWRGFFLQLYLVAVYGFHIWMYYGKGQDSEVLNYVGCVTSHPRGDPPPCERVYGSDGGAICVYLLLVFLFPFFLPLVFYWTNPLVWAWWRELCVNHRPIREMSEMSNLSRTDRTQKDESHS